MSKYVLPLAWAAAVCLILSGVAIDYGPPVESLPGYAYVFGVSKPTMALVIIESMKMEIAVLAPCDGEVIQMHCRVGGQVSAGQDLLVIQIDE